MGYLASFRGKIFYTVRGEGPPLLLLHGLSRSSRFWSGFDQKLSRHFRVITMDSRGLGRSSKQAGWLDRTRDLADDSLELLHTLGIQKTHVMGQSLGGMIALSLALKSPETILSATVINSSSAGTKTRRVSSQALGAMALGTVLRPLLCKLMVHTCTSGSTPEQNRRQFTSIYEGIVRDEGLPWLTTMKQMVTALRFKADQEGIKSLKRPALIIYGEDDRFVPPENSVALFRLLPRAELHAVQGGGHELPMDQPAEVCRILRSFIGRVSNA